MAVSRQRFRPVTSNSMSALQPQSCSSGRLASSWIGQKTLKEPAVAFHNGVFGKFEDPKFENGTRRFMAQLKRMKDAGVRVYVGGGEGGTALEKYGQPDWVTHNFTAGGTVLNALGSEPVPFLVALHMAANKK